MLKTVLIYNKDETKLNSYDILRSLEENSIDVIVIRDNSLEDDGLASLVNKAALIPYECLLLTDSVAMAKQAHFLNITCIGIQDSPSNNYFDGASCVVDSPIELDYETIIAEYNHSHNLPSNILTTKRLIIKELTTDDVVSLYSLYANKEHVRFLPPLDTLEKEVEKQEAYIKNMYNLYRFGLWGVYLKDTDKLIGRCGLQCIELHGNTEIELGYLIDATYSHMGYGYEATKSILEYAKNNLYIDSIVTRIHKDNLPSKQLAIKLGFKLIEPLEDNNELHYRIDL